MKFFRLVPLMAVLAVGVLTTTGAAAQSTEPEAPAPVVVEEPAPEVPAPEAPAPEEPAPEAPAPDPAPEDPAPEAPAPDEPVVVEDEAPAAPASARLAPETQCPESGGSSCEPPEEHKVLICHRTNAVDNPYASAHQEVDDSAVDGAENPPLSDHQNHGGPAFDPNVTYPPPHNGDQWGDIIPPFYADGVTPGYWTPLNWDAAGQAIFYNDCVPTTPPPPEFGSLDVFKVVQGDGTPAEGTEFTVDVDCDDDAFDTTVTFDEFGDPTSGNLPITDIPEGTSCTVTETDAGGADDVELDPLDGVVVIEGDETVTVTVTNTFEDDGCPDCIPTAFAFSDVTPPTCEAVGTFLQQEFPGVSIVVDPPFDGPGTYTVTATLDDPNAVWEDIGGNEPRSRTITVEDALGFQSEDPNAPCFLEPPCEVDCEPPCTVDCKPPIPCEINCTPPVVPPPNVVPTCEDLPSQAGCTPTLPRTGFDAGLLIPIGAGLASGGGVLVRASRRRLRRFF